MSLVSESVPLSISVQVCREFLSVTTRQPLGATRALTSDEAVAALDYWRSACVVLKEDDAVLAELLTLVREYQVLGKQVHDANIVATMLVEWHRPVRDLELRRLSPLRRGVAIEPLVS